MVLKKKLFCNLNRWNLLCSGSYFTEKNGELFNVQDYKNSLFFINFVLFWKNLQSFEMVLYYNLKTNNSVIFITTNSDSFVQTFVSQKARSCSEYWIGNIHGFSGFENSSPKFVYHWLKTKYKLFEGNLLPAKLPGISLIFDSFNTSLIKQASLSDSIVLGFPGQSSSAANHFYTYSLPTWGNQPHVALFFSSFFCGLIQDFKFYSKK